MYVVGKGSYTIADTGQTADVNAYNSQYDTMQISMLDAAVQYDCPYSGKLFILVIRNIPINYITVILIIP